MHKLGLFASVSDHLHDAFQVRACLAENIIVFIVVVD